VEKYTIDLRDAEKLTRTQGVDGKFEIMSRIFESWKADIPINQPYYIVNEKFYAGSLIRLDWITYRSVKVGKYDPDTRRNDILIKLNNEWIVMYKNGLRVAFTSLCGFFGISC